MKRFFNRIKSYFIKEKTKNRGKIACKGYKAERGLGLRPDLTWEIKELMVKHQKKPSDLVKEMKRSFPAISNGISGRRPNIQKEIYNYLKGL